MKGLTKKPMISFQNFSYSYPTKPDALVDINFEVYKGEVLGIIGPNGAGKSTLCKSLNGLVPHFYGGTVKGSVIVAGMNTLEHTVAELSTKVGLVFQEPENQLSGLALTVEEEVGFGLSMLGFPRELIRERVAEALKKVGLKGLEKRSPFELSGGQQQRLAIATVLAMKPEIMVLDEPVALLDPIGKYEVFSTIKELIVEGSTIVIAEHEIEELAYLTDYIVLLDEGRVVSINDSRSVLSQVSKLKEIGIDPPSVTELAYMLEQNLGIKFTQYPIKLPEALKLYSE
ncbi:MAG: ATP-binding cassette domain-containing protein, partial [Candidatus Bathyarchaeia archaeon]